LIGFSPVYIKSISMKIIEPKHNTLQIYTTDILEYYNLTCFAGMVTPVFFYLESTRISSAKVGQK
jgi:hypothetical protein